MADNLSELDDCISDVLFCFVFVRSGNGEQRFPGLGSFSIYSCFFLFFLLFFSAVNCYFLVSYPAMYLFLNFPAQWTSIGRGNRRWKAALESLFARITVLIVGINQRA